MWECDREPMPQRLRSALLDSSVLKLSWNVPFERRGFARFCGIETSIDQWFDVKILALYFSLPGKLKAACKALHLPTHIAKMAEAGNKSIHLFSKPKKKRKSKATLFGEEPPTYVFNNRENKPEQWQVFCDYCKQDSRVESYIHSLLRPNFMLPRNELILWYMDQAINQRGMPVNRLLVKNGVALAKRSLENLRKMLVEKTGLENPNSDEQMLGWLKTQGYTATSMNKKVVEVQLREAKLTPLGREVILIRKEFKRSSWTKLEAILMRLSDDDRLRECFAFYGASRTGRWAGQDVQFQNLARPSKDIEKNLPRVLELIAACDFETLQSEFAPIVEVEGIKIKLPSVLSAVVSCLRSVFQAKSGHIFVVSDLSAIENRVLGWLAGCHAILDVFKRGLDPYLAFACHMYNIKYEQVTKDQRQIAKPATLGCGYGLGPGVVKNPDGTYSIIWKCSECEQKVKSGHRCYDENNNPVGDLMKTGLLGYAESMGITLTPEQAYESWLAFHKAYPEVPELWTALERAAIRTIQTGKKTIPSVKLEDGGYRLIPWVEYSRVKFGNQWVLRCKLPSGRYLHYINARVHEEEKYSERTGRFYIKKSIFYDGIGHGVGATTKGAVWGKVYTYGGKLTENIVQAISRDILAHGMMLAEEMGFTLVGHVHDELICEEKLEQFRLGLPELIRCMAQTPIWAPGLPLGADGYESGVYKKG